MQFNARKDTIILLPETLDQRLKNLARVRDETFGCIIYSVRQDVGSYQCVNAATIYTITGGDSPKGSFIDESVKLIPQRFCSTNTNFGYFEFHTHPLGTPYFSNADKRYFTEEIKKNPHYFHLLVTPKMPPNNYILWKSPEIKSLSIAISEVPENFNQIEQEIQRDLRLTEQRLGNQRQRIGTTRRRR